jgi:predicted O-linked N-acetylglucosamine transferase (SPINDLY family)
VAACDIVLDTFVYGAHTTASDVLWSGVPKIAHSGKSPIKFCCENSVRVIFTVRRLWQRTYALKSGWFPH